MGKIARKQEGDLRLVAADPFIKKERRNRYLVSLGNDGVKLLSSAPRHHERPKCLGRPRLEQAWLLRNSVALTTAVLDSLVVGIVLVS